MIFHENEAAKGSIRYYADIFEDETKNKLELQMKIAQKMEVK